MYACMYVCVDKYNGERGLPAVTKFIQVSYRSENVVIENVCMYACTDKYNGERGLPAVTKFMQASY